MTDTPYPTAKEAYAHIHVCLAHGVESALDDCDYLEAIKWADLMFDLEENKMDIMTVETIDGQTQRIII